MTAFEELTNLYSVSKTLRFELKPAGKDGNTLSAEESAKLFKEILDQDRKIKDAYLALKPVMDTIHEEIINSSLSPDEARQIDFLAYYTGYKNDNEDAVKNAETSLREAIGSAFEKAANELAKNAGNDEKGKPIFKKKKGKDVVVKYLTQAGIIKYIENN
ncbi:hypothetical protein, partial [Treponema endosymbiont of Eucomonympha sp.]|uniref:hypothetical protein n=1 Tax=Treponema endosymbiont of Eucomonympha sp. TaxID=1580831 RepID=UPI000B098E9B